MLTTQDIEKALQNHKLTESCFGGVFASDKTPEELGVMQALVINTDPSHQPGEHWYAVYRDANGLMHQFDSYGLRRKMKWNGPVRQVVHRRIQGFAPICGHYCLLFILSMVASWIFDVSYLDSDVEINDKLVLKTVCREFRL